jgi:hypothetical protein
MRSKNPVPVTRIARFAAVVGVALLAACGPSATGTTPSATLTVATTSPAAAQATAAAAAVAKVSANNATNEQLIAAFTAAGIPNPSSWAREVQEYRPYDTGDANITKLRQNLVKYNPAAGVVDKIVATLSLP